MADPMADFRKSMAVVTVAFGSFSHAEQASTADNIVGRIG
jgi:hypothetical protein